MIKHSMYIYLKQNALKQLLSYLRSLTSLRLAFLLQNLTMNIQNYLIKLQLVFEKNSSNIIQMKEAKQYKYKQIGPKKAVVIVAPDQIIDKGVSEKFRKFLLTQRSDKLKEHINVFHGRDFPIAYRKEFNFHEQWQNKDTSEGIAEVNLLQEAGNAYLGFSVALMLLNVVAIWVISYERYFNNSILSQNSQLYLVEILFQATQITLGAYHKYQIIKYVNLKALFVSNWRNFICIGHFTLISLWNQQHLFMNVLEIVIIVILYAKAAKIYQFLKMMEIGLSYQNQLKIFDLFFNLLIQAHVFALILYSASKMNPESNWVAAIHIDTEPAIEKYIYSFYFACTTMLTIGYGDITPKCPQEIMVTVLIEIVGVVAFGYLLNQMGHTLSKMRNQGQKLERDLQTITKMSKYYNLERSLQNKARAFLLSTQQRGEELKVEDERNVLLKLNEQLREQIQHENSLAVIKSCIFFICHWSKKLQSSVALLLQKRLFAPNQRLIPSGGPSRIFIIKHGRIDIFMNRYGERSSQQQRKLLKVISSVSMAEVSDNIYGYTAAFSNRTVRLEAVAAEFTSTYSISGQDFLRAVRRNDRDFQYFHQVKCRIDQSPFCQQWQAPAINNIRQHYSPSHFFVIKKHRKKTQKSKNKRHYIIRNARHSMKILYNLVNKSVSNVDQQSQSLNYISQRTIIFEKEEKIDEGAERFSSSSSSQELTEEWEDSFDEFHNHTIDAMNTAALLQNLSQERDNKKLISHIFQSYHQFHNFFRFSNISTVLNALQFSNSYEKKIVIPKSQTERTGKRRRISVGCFAF